MLNFVRALESFETPAIIARPAIELFTTKIYREALAAYPPNYNLSASCQAPLAMERSAIDSRRCRPWPGSMCTSTRHGVPPRTHSTPRRIAS